MSFDTIQAYQPVISHEVEISKVRRFLKNKWERERTANFNLWMKAKKDFDAIVSMLIQKYCPLRIYQWGSVLQKEEFCSISDIDIGVEGAGGAERFFRMYDDAMQLTEFPLDMVEMEKIAPEFKKLIQLKGQLVYERPGKTISITP